jgi:hypothetical protein
MMMSDVDSDVHALDDVHDGRDVDNEDTVEYCML